MFSLCLICHCILTLSLPAYPTAGFSHRGPECIISPSACLMFLKVTRITPCMCSHDTPCAFRRRSNWKRGRDWLLCLFDREKWRDSAGSGLILDTGGGTDLSFRKNFWWLLFWCILVCVTACWKKTSGRVCSGAGSRRSKEGQRPGLFNHSVLISACGIQIY